MLVKDIKLGNRPFVEFIKIVCISNMCNNKLSQTIIYGGLTVGEKYLAPTRFWTSAKKIKLENSESYIDIHDLNQNQIGNYPHLFQELSLIRNDKIETILK